MKEYGWIPPKEFEELPIPTILDLLDQIIKQKKEEEKAMKSSNKKGGLSRRPTRGR